MANIKGTALAADKPEPLEQIHKTQVLAQVDILLLEEAEDPFHYLRIDAHAVVLHPDPQAPFQGSVDGHQDPSDAVLGAEAVENGVFHHALEADARDPSLLQAGSDTEIAADAVAVAQLLQLHKAAGIGHLLRHGNQVGMLLFVGADHIRQQGQSLAGAAVLLPGFQNGQPVNGLEGVVEKMGSHLLLQRLGPGRPQRHHPLRHFAFQGDVLLEKLQDLHQQIPVLLILFPDQQLSLGILQQPQNGPDRPEQAAGQRVRNDEGSHNAENQDHDQQILQPDAVGFQSRHRHHLHADPAEMPQIVCHDPHGPTVHILGHGVIGQVGGKKTGTGVGIFPGAVQHHISLRIQKQIHTLGGVVIGDVGKEFFRSHRDGYKVPVPGIQIGLKHGYHLDRFILVLPGDPGAGKERLTGIPRGIFPEDLFQILILQKPVALAAVLCRSDPVSGRGIDLQGIVKGLPQVSVDQGKYLFGVVHIPVGHGNGMLPPEEFLHILVQDLGPQNGAGLIQQGPDGCRGVVGASVSGGIHLFQQAPVGKMLHHKNAQGQGQHDAQEGQQPVFDKQLLEAAVFNAPERGPSGQFLLHANHPDNP